MIEESSKDPSIDRYPTGIITIHAFLRLTLNHEGKSIDDLKFVQMWDSRMRMRATKNLDSWLSITSYFVHLEPHPCTDTEIRSCDTYQKERRILYSMS